MKFDPFAWNEVQPNEKIKADAGILRVRCSVPAPLYVEAQGFEALASVAVDHEVEVSAPVTFHVAAAKGVRIFWQPPAVLETVFAAEQEVFTNIDRMPYESGAMAEVTRARRQLEMERRAMLRDIRVEANRAKASVRAAATPPASQTDLAAVVVEGLDEPE